MLPVVHEQVWDPELLRVYSHVLHVPVLGLVPREVVVSPVLKESGGRERGEREYELRK